MALETLIDVKKIDDFLVMTNEDRPKKQDGSIDWDLFDDMRKIRPISIDHKRNMISFKLQNGPIKEVGGNGCQVDTMVAATIKIITKLNDKFPCRENALAITKLQEAYFWLKARKADREIRGVEGFEKI